LHIILFVVGGVALGVALGFLLAHARETTLLQRNQKLEEELSRAEMELITYRSQVGQHMSDTGDLLKNLALNLCDTYDHLAEGAQVLCPDEIKNLRRGHAAAELLLSGTPMPVDEQTSDPLPNSLEIDEEIEVSDANSDTNPDSDPESETTV
jgi:uncharacterized membrane-anchored protein YhcB (DUF1043 family)